MKFNTKYLAVILILSILISASALALPTIDGKVFGLYPITNEVSLFRNVDDDGFDRGATVQVISINSFKVWTDFIFEFTADFNYDLSYNIINDDQRDYYRDHYIELSLVKPVAYNFSLNYQRVISTFEDKPINQFGIRLAF